LSKLSHYIMYFTSVHQSLVQFQSMLFYLVMIKMTYDSTPLLRILVLRIFSTTHCKSPIGFPIHLLYPILLSCSLWFLLFFSLKLFLVSSFLFIFSNLFLAVSYYDLVKQLSQYLFSFSFLFLFCYIWMHEILARVRVSIVYK